MIPAMRRSTSKIAGNAKPQGTRVDIFGGQLESEKRFKEKELVVHPASFVKPFWAH
jgi:hypothetical protein